MSEFVRPLQVPLDTDTFFANTKALLSEARSTATFTTQSTPTVPGLDSTEMRRILYKQWWAYYDNNIYSTKEMGGWRQYINDQLGSAKVANLSALFNPVERAVRAYEYVFDGFFGEDITIDDKVDKDSPVNTKIIVPIQNIWKNSNLNLWKNEFLIRVSALGSHGLRVVYNPLKKNIYLLPEDPSLIKAIDVDNRGNITQLVLEYEREEGNFYDEDNPRTVHTYIEYMSRERFWMVRDGQWWNAKTQQFVDTQAAATIPNVLGIVPYVLIHHTSIGSTFGVPCFYGHERQIDHLNALAAHINTQIRRHVTLSWFVEASGDSPKRIPMGDQNIWYVKKDLGSSSSASITPMVSNLNLAQAILQQGKLQQELSNSMPELKATDGDFISHQSGDTVSQLRLPAEQRILMARANIEYGLIKAQKIALSYGILYGLWDLGSGTGSRSSADTSYEVGQLDHKFNTRPALPISITDKLTLAKTAQANAAAASPNSPNVVGGNNLPIISSNSG